MRTSKALWVLGPSLGTFLLMGCTPAESFTGVPAPDGGGIEGTGGQIQIAPGTGGDGSGGTGGDGSGGMVVDPGGSGGEPGTGGAGSGGVSMDAARDMASPAGSGGVRDAGGGADLPRDLPPEVMTVLTYENHCLPSRWTATASLMGDSAIDAVDGDPATKWWTMAPQVPDEYVQIDLGGIVRLNQVVLDNTGGHATDYPRGYRILASTDGTTFPTTAAPASAAPSGAVTTINFTAVNARALRIVQTGSDTMWWTVHELRLGCHPLDPSHWKLTASSSFTASPPTAAADGDLATRWTSGVNQAGNEWFLVDLGAVTSVSEVWMSTQASPDDFPVQYNLEVSSNNETFTSVATGAGQLVTKVKFTRQSARYLRIRQTGSKTMWWTIHELTIRP
jgi:hypothetical protein